MNHRELLASSVIAAAIAIGSPLVNAQVSGWDGAEPLVLAINHNEYSKPGDAVPNADLNADADSTANQSDEQAATYPEPKPASEERRRELEQEREQIYRDMLHE